jgi:hypothetical protein
MDGISPSREEVADKHVTKEGDSGHEVLFLSDGGSLSLIGRKHIDESVVVIWRI